MLLTLAHHTISHESIVILTMVVWGMGRMRWGDGERRKGKLLRNSMY